jgi:N-acetylmuramoyl-L-alanine amidase
VLRVPSLVFVSIAVWAHAQPLAECRIAVDVGHSSRSPGATSARGVPEFSFNVAAAQELVASLEPMPGLSAFLIRSDSSDLRARDEAALHGGADLLLSIHHDSVQPRYLRAWQYKGNSRSYSDAFTGYSLFFSRRNRRGAESLATAIRIGRELTRAGFRPTLHHAERIAGESRELVDKTLGIYRFDELIVLKEASVPAVLIEHGVIVNRNEELQLEDPARRVRFARAMAQAVSESCRTFQAAR